MNDIGIIKALAEKQGHDPDYIKILLNYADRLIHNEVPVIFDAIHLSLLAGLPAEFFHDILIGNQSKYYCQFEISKKDGNKRIIDSPEPSLKNLQRMLLINILENVKVSDYCHGFTKGKSIVTNAGQHVGKKLVYNIDLKDFFPTIKQARIKKIFDSLGYSQEVSNLLSCICCLRGQLPQGAPTSPVISNIVCIRLDKRLGKLAESNGLTYSRYADDLTFSGGYYLKKLRSLIKTIIEEEGFQIHPEKENLYYSNMRQMVTGLVVNSKVSIPRNYLNRLRQEIHYAKILRPDIHSQNLKDRGEIEYVKINFKGYLYGKILFINSVNPELADKLFEEMKYIYWE